MRTIKSLPWVVGLSMRSQKAKAKSKNRGFFILTLTFLLLTFPAPVRADHAPDITGTNYWNNTAPQFGRRGGRLDPQLAERVRRFNEESEQAYNGCLAAVEAAPQSSGGPRQYLRNPQDVAGEYPAECQRLNALRNERDNLRNELEGVGQISPAFKSW